MSEQILPLEQKTIGQVVEEALFNDPDYPYICVDNQLLQFNGASHEKRTDQQEEKRVVDFLATQKLIDYRTGRHKYPYATTKYVNEAISWIKKRLTVNPDTINPPGINCKNGVLRLSFSESDVSWELVPHSPKIIYTYEPLVEYDPNALTEQCDRMLQALDEPQRDIFLKIASSALDLSAVRKRIGRQIRVVFVLGSGRNGKDVLRLALTYLLGNVGVVSPSLMDFRDYDKGRRFGLANLQHALVVWSSENVRFIQIDNLQSLKALNTGDPLVCERKHRDPVEFIPNAIAFFNLNEVPFLNGTLEAVKSRYVILSFNKVFSETPDTQKGELQADPRFKYDREFMCKEVLPAFLNYLLDALRRLLKDGIDYSVVEETMQASRIASSHLFEFVQDVGLVYTGNHADRLYAGEIFNKLIDWYVENDYWKVVNLPDGSVTYIREDDNPRDKTVKSANQVSTRFKDLFPDSKRIPNDGRGVSLSGLAFWPDF